MKEGWGGNIDKNSNSNIKNPPEGFVRNGSEQPCGRKHWEITVLVLFSQFLTPVMCQLLQTCFDNRLPKDSEAGP